jgi:hypothetical protein
MIISARTLARPGGCTPEGLLRALSLTCTIGSSILTGLHRNLDSDCGVLLALRKMVSMIGPRGCKSDAKRANPVKYGRSRVKIGGYGIWIG